MLTEDEARKKWCPFVRLSDPDEPLGCSNRHVNSNGQFAQGPAFRCIASECMAWRWEKETRPLPGVMHPGGGISTSNAVEKPKDAPPGFEWRYSDLYDLHLRAGTHPNHFSRWSLHRVVAVGHCGLAGAP